MSAPVFCDVHSFVSRQSQLLGNECTNVLWYDGLLGNECTHVPWCDCLLRNEEWEHYCSVVWLKLVNCGCLLMNECTNVLWCNCLLMNECTNVLWCDWSCFAVSVYLEMSTPVFCDATVYLQASAPMFCDVSVNSRMSAPVFCDATVYLQENAPMFCDVTSAAICRTRQTREITWYIMATADLWKTLSS